MTRTRLRLVAVVLVLSAGKASAQTPLAGHYPPGQSGLRGASAPAGPGWSITNFNRFFSNLEAKDADGATTRTLDEMRYANITMVTWNTDWTVLGLRYGAMAGIPFATGNLNPSSEDTGTTALGLGDVLLTPLALYRRGTAFDYTFQLTLWSSSGRFTPGSPDNRGAGFESLVWSLGGAWYPRGGRDRWSVSALSRIEQNFEQDGTGIDPGEDVVIDWGVGRMTRPGGHALEVGASGFATWQLSDQSGGTTPPDLERYRYFGAGPEASYAPWDRWTFRLRAHWEFEARNAVRGNNLWLIANFAP